MPMSVAVIDSIPFPFFFSLGKYLARIVLNIDKDSLKFSS